MEEEILHPKEKQEIEANEFISLVSQHKKITNVKVNGSIQLIESEQFKLKSSEIINCDFEDEFVLKAGQAINSLIFVNCKFAKRMLLFDSDIKKIRILRSTFEQYFAFKKLQTDILNIEDCIIKNVRELKIKEFKTSELSFKNNESSNAIYIKPLMINKLFLEGSETGKQITFSNLGNNIILNEMYIFNSATYKTDYVLRNFSTKKLQIIGELKDAMLFINNANVETGILDYFFNQGNLKFNGIHPLTESSRVIIKNSSLGNAQINNCNFSGYKNVIISNSSIIDIVPVNVAWCSSKNLTSHDEKGLKENYRQLKLVAGKNEDIDNKLIFEKLEMHQFLAVIKKTRGKFVDKFILYTNYYSNNFGLSWLRAFYWLLITTIVWYTSIKFLAGQTRFDTSLIIEEVGKFLLFINPIHQFEKIFGIDPGLASTNGGILFDAISRIFGAYFIYQFISAFRKYSKK